MSKDYYKILDVKKGASDAQIKSAYRRLARKYHPDVNPSDKNAEQQFKNISEAYSILGDKEKRKQYDKFGTIDPNVFGGAGRNSGFGFSGFDFAKSGSGTNFSDIFEEIFKGKGRKQRAAAQPQKGQDLQYVVNLSFMDAINGITTKIAIGRLEGCGTCHGKGLIQTGSTSICRVCGGSGKKTVQSGMLRFDQECYACGGSGASSGEPCRSCRGTGTVQTKEDITVRIPAGVANGSRVRVPRKGNAGARGGANGDLYIITNVEPHPVFTRKGNNIYLTVPVTVSEAALGGKLDVPTIDGSATIRIPPSTQSGQRFRLRERGAPVLRGGGRGDQFVEVKIVLPKVIDEGAKDIYRKLGEHEHWNPRSKLFGKE